MTQASGDWGTYSPACIIVAGVTSVGNAAASWSRVGKSFSIGGTFILQPSTSVGQVAFFMTLPAFVSVNFSAGNLGGVAHAGNQALKVFPLNITNESGGIRVLFNGSNLGIVINATWAFSFTGSMA